MLMLKQIEWITLNVVSFGWMIASAMDYLPVLVGILVGLSIAGLNVARIITEAKKWKDKKSDDNEQGDKAS